MESIVTVLSALSAGVSAALAVLVAAPDVGMPSAVVVGMAAISAGLAATTAVLSRPKE